MKLSEWLQRTIKPDAWTRIYRTKPGALSLVIDQMLYNLTDENKEKEHRGIVLSLNNSEHFYVSGLDRDTKWPDFDGRDGSYVDVKKSLREIRDLLLASAARESIS